MTQESPLLDSVAQAFATGILKTVTSRGGASPGEVESAVRADAEAMAAHNVSRVIDVESRRWLALSSQVLASYRNLLPPVGESRTALSILQVTMPQPFKAGIKADVLFFPEGINSGLCGGFGLDLPGLISDDALAGKRDA